MSENWKLGKAPIIKLVITLLIIQTAVRRSSGRCLIARAIREWGVRNNQQVWSISIERDKILFNIGEVRYCYTMPEGPIAILLAWDNEKDGEPSSVKPFSFYLRNGTTRPVNRRHVPGTPSAKYKPRDTVKIARTTRVKGKVVAKGSTTAGVRKTRARKCDRRWAGIRVTEKPPGHKNTGAR